MRTIFSTIISSLGGRIKEGLLLLALLASTSIIYASNTAVDGIYYDFDSSTLTATVTYRGIAYNEYSNEYTGSVTIPETVTYNGTTYNVTSISSSAFRDCSSLTSVTIPESVQTIGWYPFSDCSSLTSVVWNAKNCADCTDRYYPFYSIESQITSFTFGENVEYIPKSLCSGMSQLTSITIPNSVTSIGGSAFQDCSKLTSITIPNSVTSIGSSAFGGCSSLTSVIWNAKNCADCTPFYSIESQITSFTFGDNVEHIPAELCLGMSQLTSITIPNSVTSIGKDAFYNTGIYNDESNWGDGVLYISNCLIDAKSDITGSYTIKDNTQLIADNAFYKCTYLTSVTIPESVTSIGERAFCYCSKLTSVTIPNSVTSIGYAAFDGCSALTEPVYNEHLFVYMPSSYSGAYEIPEGVKQIAGAAFSGCSKLTSITIPNSVTSIGSSAFSRCSKLTAVHITDIAAWCRVAFDASLANPLFYAKNLYLNGELITYLVVPEGVTSIGDYAFEGCSSLTSVTIPNSVTSIGERAFYGCSALTSIELHNNIQNLRGAAFGNCTSLNSIVWNIKGSDMSERGGSTSGFPSLNNGMFIKMPQRRSASSSSTTDIFEGSRANITSVTIGDSVQYLPSSFCEDMEKLTSITIPDNVKTIGHSAFFGCSSLTSVIIPENITRIGHSAFANCDSLSSVIWNAKKCEDFYRNTSGNSTGGTPNYYPFHPEDVTSITFGENVEYIPAYLCCQMKNLTSVTISNSVTSIGEKAFYYCSSLTSVTIPNSVTSIGERAFCYCSSLTSATIGNSVTSIGSSAFYKCSSLTSITIPNSVTSIGSQAFADCSSLTSVTIGNSVTSIGSSAFYHCSSLTSITIPNSVTSIGERAFCYCSSLTSATIGNSVTSIGSSAFAYCSSLTSVTIGNSVTSIGSEAFYNCSKLTAVHITDIAAWCRVAFDGSFANPLFYAKNLYLNGDLITYLVVPEGVTSIGDYAFYNCSALTSITVPKNVVVIGESTFANCSSLNSVQWNAIDCYIKTDSQYKPSSPFYNSNVSSLVIGENVEVLPDAFCANVSSLDSITIGKNIKYIGKEAFRNCSTLVKTNYTGDVTGWCEINFYDCYSNPNYYAKNLYINGQEVKDVVVPNTVNKIQPYAFYGCPSLSSIVIPKSVKTIGENAFGECRKLYDVYCYPTTPPTAESNSFTNYNVYLHVLCDNLRDYQMDMVFGSFKYIECIESEDVTTNGVNITPSLNDVTITWPTENDADTYSIVIKQDGVVFCTLTFNAEGQLMNIAFAPARNGNHLAQYAEQAVNGYRFTVTGLEEATTYAYNITTKDASNQTLATYSGEFTTLGDIETAVEDIVQKASNCQKIIRDNQLIIIRDGVEYNAMGQEL